MMKMSNKEFLTETHEYQRKPITVEAYQTDTELEIETLEGTMKANKGDYIVTGIKGEQYPVKQDIFKETYTPVDENDSSIEDYVMDNCIEWSNLLSELSRKEEEYMNIKEKIFDKKQWMEENTDFKELYGKNNADIRKMHFKKFLVEEYALEKELELSIDYLKRRLTYLRELVHVKTILMEVNKK